MEEGGESNQHCYSSAAIIIPDLPMFPFSALPFCFSFCECVFITTAAAAAATVHGPLYLFIFLLFSFFIFLCKLEAVSWSVHEEAEERSAGTFAAIDCAKSVTSSDRPAATSRQRSAWRLILLIYFYLALFFFTLTLCITLLQTKKYIIYTSYPALVFVNLF